MAPAIRCPKCGHHARQNEIYCVKCGEPLPSQSGSTRSQTPVRAVYGKPPANQGRGCLIAATIGLAILVIAAAAAIYLFLLSPNKEAKPASSVPVREELDVADKTGSTPPQDQAQTSQEEPAETKPSASPEETSSVPAEEAKDEPTQETSTVDEEAQSEESKAQAIAAAHAEIDAARDAALYSNPSYYDCASAAVVQITGTITYDGTIELPYPITLDMTNAGGAVGGFSSEVSSFYLDSDYSYYAGETITIGGTLGIGRNGLQSPVISFMNQTYLIRDYRYPSDEEILQGL